MENLRNFGIDQTFVQRYSTARSEEEARKSVWFCAVAFLPVSTLLLLIGTGLFAFYAARAEALPERLHALNMADHVFPYFIVNAMPVGLTGLLIAAIFAAGMSTVDSSLNCVATLTLSDFYRRYFRTEAGERESVWVLRISTLAWGLVAVALSLSIIGVESALDLWWQFSSVVGGAMLGLFLLGILSRRPGSGPALVGVAAGVALLVWLSLGPTLAPTRAEFDLMTTGPPPAETIRTDPSGGRVLPRPVTLTGLALYGSGNPFRAGVGDVSLRVRSLEPVESDPRLRVPRWRRIPDPHGEAGSWTENLIVNGSFNRGEGGLEGWQVVPGPQNTAALENEGGQVIWEQGASPTIGRAGVSQDLSIDVAGAWNAVLAFDVVVEHQGSPGASLSTGMLSAPLVAEVRYLDDSGEEHTWRHGFIAQGESELARITRVRPGEGGHERYASPFHANLGNALGTATIVLVGFLATIVAERLRGRRGRGWEGPPA
jgi:hypothetical protein